MEILKKDCLQKSNLGKCSMNTTERNCFAFRRGVRCDENCKRYQYASFSISEAMGRIILLNLISKYLKTRNMFGC